MDDNLNKAIDELYETNANTLNELEKLLNNINIEDTKSKKIKDEKINKLFSETNDSIDALKKIAKFNIIDLSLNTQIPQIASIIKLITKLGFQSFSEFGKKAIKLPYIISIGEEISINIVKDLVSNLSKLDAGFIKVNFDKSNSRTIYIGSYDMKSKRIIINDDLIEKINQADGNALFGKFFYHNYG